MVGDLYLQQLWNSARPGKGTPPVPEIIYIYSNEPVCTGNICSSSNKDYLQREFPELSPINNIYKFKWATLGLTSLFCYTHITEHLPTLSGSLSVGSAENFYRVLLELF